MCIKNERISNWPEPRVHQQNNAIFASLQFLKCKKKNEKERELEGQQGETFDESKNMSMLEGHLFVLARLKSDHKQKA